MTFRSTRKRYDVVFYAPFIGAVLSRWNSSPAGGAEVQILMLSKALAGRGLSVAIIGCGSPPELPAEVAGVRIIPLRWSNANGRLGGKVLEVLRIWHALWRAPSRTVVYRCVSPELGLIGAYTRVARRRLVFSAGNVIDFEPDRFFRRRRHVLLYRLGVRLSDAIVVQTEEQVGLCRRIFGRTPALIKSLASPTDGQREAPEAFLWIGRLVSYKRPHEYIALARAVPEARFWMVGVPAGPGNHLALDPGAVIAAAREVSNLEMLSPRPHGELGALMDRAIASVNTAEYEGMPNVLLEAWSRGVPALVLNHDPGGVVTAHELGGFGAGSLDRLAALAREQWASKGDRRELAARCRNYIADHHAPERVVDQWLDVISGGSGVAPRGHQAKEGDPICVG